MKKALFCLFFGFSLVFTVNAFASPFLVCDPNAKTDKYTVKMDGIEVATDYAAEGDGSIRYDFASYANTGTHTVEIAACNVWGCSAFVALPFDTTLPASPDGLTLSP